MRTSSALCQDILCGPEVLASRALDAIPRRPQLMFGTSRAEGHLSGLLADRTLVDVRWLGEPLGPWDLAQQTPESCTFSSPHSQCAITYTPAVIDFERLGGNPREAAQTLLQYLQNARNGDPRIVQITERTTARLDLEILEVFGWSRHEHHYEPPKDVDQGLYARASSELELIIEQFESRAYAASTLFEVFSSHSSVPATPPQVVLGITSADTEEQVFEQYQNQVASDPKHTPHYFEALHDVAGQSEMLQVKYMEQESLGVVPLRDIRQAYANLGLDPSASDSEVLKAFFARPEHTHALQKIAGATDSPVLSRAVAAVNIDYQGSLRLFGASYQSEDALVAARAKTFLGSSEPLVQLEGKCGLLQIAQNRRSGPLLHLYESTFPQPLPQDPYTFLSLSPHMDDSDIVTAYELIAGEEPAEVQLQLRSYLRAIAVERGSEKLVKYLEVGALDERAADFPVGLWNIGNTCYLNSLLQFYNTLKPFKGALQQLDAQQQDQSLEKKKVGGRVVPWSEVVRSQQFLGLLKGLYEQMATTKDRFVLPSEQLAYMALVPPKEQNTTENLGAALERQQDVTEIIENVLYQFEAGVNAHGYDKEGEQQDLIKELFYGTIKQTLAKDEPSAPAETKEQGEATAPRIKEERISSLMVSAEGPMDIYSALDGYFCEEAVELENSRFLRTVSILNLPPVLQIQIQRVQFNRRTYEVFKNNSPISLPETLYMDRYFDTEDEAVLSKRKERVQLQAQLKALETKLGDLQRLQPNNVSRVDNLATCAEWLKEYGEEELLGQVQYVIQQIKADISETREALAGVQQAIATQFEDYTQHGYRIHSLFIHRGQVNYGHYWIYIRDFEHMRWLKYNDETVTEVDEQEVFDYSESNTATPYFLVYVKEDYVQELQSVDRREPEIVDVDVEEPEVVAPSLLEPAMPIPEIVTPTESPPGSAEPELIQVDPMDLNEPVEEADADVDAEDEPTPLKPVRPTYQRALSSKLGMKPIVSPRTFAWSALEADDADSVEFVEAASARGSALHTPRQTPPPNESL